MADRDLEFWDDDGDAFKAIVAGWPKVVKLAIGRDIRRVQQGANPLNGKPLHGFAVQAAEIKHRGGARVIYSVAYSINSGKVFIADAFMKDSRDGSEMRKSDRERIQARLKQYRAKYSKQRRNLH